ncbi:flagellar hook-length control protein FliK [Paenibacillus typhae]|uniref:Flagellar hook-length control protein FliK n=1 Tax=Paenibacillus typhae TaxID=1174501 RepID=A0A1G8L3K1_9BACL|nr:flagellar hook-length control protein FliK [Paenibacillus typhae]SDI50299.1 flagellar hook-length control protein FliK [Paenibacillus typhae]
MSLVIPSFSGGNMLPANGTAGAGGTAVTNGTTASAGGASTAQPFAQTLIQTMTGATGKAETAAQAGAMASLLQGLLAAVQSGDEETSGKIEVKHIELLKRLTEDMDKLDESLSADPALLAALQGWLTQVAQLLSGTAPQGKGEAGEDTATAALPALDPMLTVSGTSEQGEKAAEGTVTPALSPLARNAETIRFVVQDELNSLVTMLQQAAVNGDEALATQGAELLKQFSAILDEAIIPDNKTKGKGVNNAEAAVQGKHTEIGAKTQGADKAVPVLVDPSVTAKIVKETPDSPVTKAAIAGSSQQSATAEETLTEAGTAEDNNDVLTAGQLSIREGLTAPLKAETARVPVTQFAQQMDTFISGKLEIVRKGGVAEAVITLFPENLGQVDVKLTMQNGNLIAQFATTHSGAKEMLEQQMSQLRAALQSQGIQVEKLEVTQNNTPLFSQFNGQQGRQPNSGGQQNGHSRDRREDIADAVLAAELNGEFKEWAANSGQDIRNPDGRFSAEA